MHDVSTKVHAESHTDDDNVHAGDLNGDAPPMHEASHIHTCQQDTNHHKQ